MRTGIDATSGKPLNGWDHCVQSIRRCLTTRYGSRVMRRHLGAAVPDIQDANADPITMFRLFASIVDAINDPDGGEPGFSLRTLELVEYGRAGRFGFLLSGDYFPRGHKGDFAVRQPASLTWVAP